MYIFVCGHICLWNEVKQFFQISFEFFIMSDDKSTLRFSCLEDPKFEHFKPVMDAYISGHFAAALVYKGLLSCVRHCCDLVPQTERQEPIQKCFKSLEYIAKFVIQSRKLFSQVISYLGI